MKTAEDFLKATGREPEDDDLDRVNCDQAGTFGHFLCGWCKHDKPKFECQICIEETFCNPLAHNSISDSEAARRLS